MAYAADERLARQFFASMPWSAQIAMYLGVFCSFAPLGLLQSTFRLQLVPWWEIAAITIYSGTIAIVFAIFGTRAPRWIGIPVLAHLGISVLLPRWLPSPPPLIELQGETLAAVADRLRAVGVLTIGSLVLAFISFLIVIRGAGVRFAAVQTELRLARDIHGALVPALADRTPALEWRGVSRPSGEVGGDLVDVLRTDRSWLATIADVSGHGVAAGVVMGMYKTAFRTAATDTTEVGSLTTRVNHIMAGLRQPHMFITAALLGIDDQGRVSYVLAGHPPMLHVEAAGPVTWVGESQLALTLLDDVAYETRHLWLAPGDTLLVVTDGLLEVFDGDDRELGYEGLRAAVAAAGTQASLVDLERAVFDACRIHGGQSDDQTMLIVRRMDQWIDGSMDRWSDGERMELTERDRAMAAGEMGPAVQLAMSVVSRMAAIVDAPRLLDVTHAHIDSSIYVGDAGLEFAERLASLGARVAVPSSLNVSGVDEHHWQEWPVPPDWAGKAHRQMVAYRSMGCTETWTCAPYQTEARPSFGQQIAWGESNAIVFANSVVGARTERYPDLFDICAAITGRVPYVGLHTDEGRLGQVLVELHGVPASLQARDEFYPVLGFLLGRLAEDRIPVVDGLTVRPTDDQLKALGAAAASSGSVALFHLVGITPEAPTRDAAFGGRAPEVIHRVDLAALNETRRQLSTVDGAEVDLVLLGSPHFSIEEFRQLAPLVRGRRKADRVEFLVTTSRMMRELAAGSGVLQDLESFGVRLTVDTCVLATPMLPPSVKTIMTNSGKYAYYVPGLLNRAITYGSLADCVESAVRGSVVRDDSAWRLS